ncbi:MAG: hypothetical protein NVSMB30_20420 [Hymenobacter sp.]
MRPSRAQRVIGLLGLLWAAALPARTQGRVDYADWRLEWAEEFNAPLDTVALAARWRFFYPWGRALDTPLETGYYTARELQTAGGVLNMTMHRLAAPQPYRGKALQYTTPLLMSRHPVDSLRPYNCNPDEGFSYGLFEVRARQPSSPSAAPGFWLFGGVPDEVDVFEGTAQAIANNFHLAPGGYWRPSRLQEQACQCFFYNADPAGNLHEQFHTYGVSWLPEGVVFYFDGVPIRHETRLVPAGCAMSVIVNMAALAGATQATDTLAIDYIRVYRPRRLPPVVPVLRPGAAVPPTEPAWLAADAPPGRPDPASFQTWRLAPPPRAPQLLALQLTDNYNPPCERALPLPVAGRWAPTWAQTDGTPELRVRTPAADSVRWTVRDLRGQPRARGATAGGGTWRPRWEALPPGTYALHLQQGAATRVQALTLVGRPADSRPDAAWQQPAGPRPAPE